VAEFGCLIAFQILYTHINGYHDFGGNGQTTEQSKRLIKLKINTQNV